MSKKKKKQQQQQQQIFSTPKPAPAVVPSAALPSSDDFSRQMSFDSMEDRIRGEEILQQAENKKLKESQEIKKSLDSAEVDRRLEQLRKQLGLKK